MTTHCQCQARKAQRNRSRRFERSEAPLHGLTVVICLCVGLVAETPATANLLGKHAAATLEKERQHDEHMWQVMRQMLIDFGHSNKVTDLDRAWAQTMSPQQWASADWPAPTNGWAEVSTGARRVAEMCRKLPSGQLSSVLQRVCAETTDLGDAIMGLLYWAQTGGQPVLQGRNDLALHFIYAAGYEFHCGAGQFASLAKEELDQSKGKPYDRDDLVAGLAGTEWVRRAKSHTNWFGVWAEGRMTLDANLPRLHYGTGAPSQRLLQQLCADLSAALTPP